MGYDIGSGSGGSRPRGGLVEEGIHPARFVAVEESTGPQFGNPQFTWTAEIYNPDGENAITTMWTNRTMSEKGKLVHIVHAMGLDKVSSTDDLIGKPFMLATIIRERDGSQYTNPDKQGGSYYTKKLKGEDPFKLSVEETLERWEMLASEDVPDGFSSDKSDGIPF